MIIKSWDVMKGLNKLKLIQRKQKLNKYHFIRALQYKGIAKLPDELNITKFSPSFQFYDPIPQIIEKYSKPKAYLRKMAQKDIGNSPVSNEPKKAGFFATIFSCLSSNPLKRKISRKNLMEKMSKEEAVPYDQIKSNPKLLTVIE